MRDEPAERTTSAGAFRVLGVVALLTLALAGMRPVPSEAPPPPERSGAPASLFLLVGGAQLGSFTGILGTSSSAALSRTELGDLCRVEPVSKSSPLFVGEFPVTGAVALDGDTFRVPALDRSLRLQFLDTEEVFHSPAELAEALDDFPAYVARRTTEGRPSKYGTPTGLAARAFAQRFLVGADRIRLEYDRPDARIGYYDRHLVHFLVRRDGQWYDYNLACVLAGWSPYFVKYGRSARYDLRFRLAEAQARAAGRGVWGDGDHYPDYPVRLSWWSRRATCIEAFEEQAATRSDWVRLGLDTTPDKLAGLEGEEVTLFATVSDNVYVRPYVAIGFLAHRNGADVKLVSPKEHLEAWHSVPWDELAGEFVYVTGELRRYRGSWEIHVTSPDQVRPASHQLQVVRRSEE